jgi:hypothetical protein
MHYERIAFAFGALFLSAAFAAPATAATTVFEKPLQGEDLSAAHFDVNRQLGRAWIDVELTRTTVAEAPESEVIPQGLDGLYYDQTRKQVIYRNGSGEVVCAEDWHFLGTTSLKDTGQCRLSLSSEKRTVDDGFSGREEKVGRVVFDAPATNGGN